MSAKTDSSKEELLRKPQHQSRLGKGSAMEPQPKFESEDVVSKDGKLANEIAIVTGGDSGIGKAVALLLLKKELQW